MTDVVIGSIIAAVAAIAAAIILGVITKSKREKASQSAHTEGSGNAVNAGGNVHIGDVVMGSDAAKTIASQSINPSNKYSLTPLPQEIRSAIDKHPPFQQTDIAKHYVGLLVRWRVNLGLIKPTKDDIARVNSKVKGTVDVWIDFEISLKKYPQFRTMQDNTSFWVSGEIAEISERITRDIELKDVTVDFSD